MTLGVACQADERERCTLSVGDERRVLGACFSGKNNFYDPKYDPNMNFERSPSIAFDSCLRVVTNDGAKNDRFGSAVQFSPGTNLIAAAAPSDNDCTGACYIFKKTASGVKQIAKIVAPDAQSRELFGEAIAMNDNYLVISSQRKNNESGKVYVYYMPTGTKEWTIIEQLTPASQDYGIRFGGAVSLGGNFLVVGAGGDHNGGWRQGSVYVYSLAGRTVEKVTVLQAPSPANKGFFGNSLSAGQGYFAVGEVGFNENQGKVHFYSYSPGDATYTHSVSASDGESGDRFATSLSVSGNQVLVGAPSWGNRRGAVYAYTLSATAAGQEQKIVNDDMHEGDGFGISVFLSSTADAIIGANFADTDGERAGTSFTYQKTVEWVPQARLASFEPKHHNYAGTAVARSGGVAIFGAPGDDSKAQFAGAIFVCDMDNGGRSIDAPSGECSDSTKQPNPSIDLLWVVDASASVSRRNWKKLRNFISSTTDDLLVGSTHTRIGAVIYSNSILDVVPIDSNTATNEARFKSYISTVSRKASYTATGLSLITAYRDIFKESNKRPGVKRVVVVATDGQPNKNHECKENGFSSRSTRCAKDAAKRLKSEDDVTFIYLRIGRDVSKNLFRGIDDARIDTTFKKLDDARQQIFDSISC